MAIMTLIIQIEVSFMDTYLSNHLSNGENRDYIIQLEKLFPEKEVL